MNFINVCCIWRQYMYEYYYTDCVALCNCVRHSNSHKYTSLAQGCLERYLMFHVQFIIHLQHRSDRGKILFMLHIRCTCMTGQNLASLVSLSHLREIPTHLRTISVTPVCKWNVMNATMDTKFTDLKFASPCITIHFKYINQPNAKFSQVYYLTFMWWWAWGRPKHVEL
jgi:hypothetical protein